tara:strand:- start:516 stop:686 length:171 start_codon:yes stop_codon:yes gene_type:complete
LEHDWTWEKVYDLKRTIPDGGVVMSCGKIMAKLTKGIPLIENDLMYLERLTKRDRK